MALSLQQYIDPYNRNKGGVTMTSILKKRLQRERKKSYGISMKKIGDFLPEHLLMEILSRLPVKTLLQFKVVCKSWYNIIKHPHFISKHLKNYYNNNDDCRGCIIAQYVITQAGEINVYEFLVDDKAQSSLAYQRIVTPIYNAYMCGPCDGIYYLYLYDRNERSFWNPSLNELKPLPPLLVKPNLPSNITFDGVSDFYGFGYDSITKDYKVIAIKSYWDTLKEEETIYIPLSIFIYSLRNDSWRYWGDLSKYYFLENNNCYVFVNESVYWLGSHDKGHYDFDVILAFNLATDNIQELQLPHYEKTGDVRLIVYHDSIALLLGCRKTKCFELWSMNDQGRTWTKNYKVNLDPDVYYRPVNHWKDNKLVFQGDYMLVLYDLDTQEIWYIDSPIDGFYRCENVFAYKESLVSVINRHMWVQET